MRTRSRIAAVLCAAAFGAAAMAITFTWTGNDSRYWDDTGNWDGGGLEGYPDDPSNDAIFPVLGDEYTIYLVTEQIDDLTIWNSYDFTASSGSPVLEVDSLSISTAYRGATVVVTISGASIVTADN